MLSYSSYNPSFDLMYQWRHLESEQVGQQQSHISAKIVWKISGVSFTFQLGTADQPWQILTLPSAWSFQYPCLLFLQPFSTLACLLTVMNFKLSRSCPGKLSTTNCVT